MADKEKDWRDPFAPSWVRVNVLRPFWEQNVRPFDPPWVKDSMWLGPRRKSFAGQDPAHDSDQRRIDMDWRLRR